MKVEMKKKTVKKQISMIATIIFVILGTAGIIALVIGRSATCKKPVPEQSSEPMVTETPEPVPEETDPPLVTVTFDDDGAITTQTVIQWEPLTLPEPAGKEGYTFFGWADEDGAIVEELPLPLVDLTLYAVYCPTLGADEHKPYLQMDASWRSRPDEPMSRAEAVMMLYSLTPLLSETDSEESEIDAPAAREQLQSIGAVLQEDLDLNDPILAGELTTMLSAYFPRSDFFLANESKEEITRLEAAKLMNLTLGRTGDPDYLEDTRKIIHDLPEDEHAACDMMEAVLAHEYEEDDGIETWTQADLPETPIEGFTSGDYELDVWLKQIIDEKTSADMALKEKLRVLYRHVRDSFRYRKGEIHTAEETGWIEQEARKMMDEGGGNCFTYSSTLCELYRALGLDAKVYVGSIAADNQPHAWVEATVDGTVYIFDVEMEWTRLRFQKPYIDFFMRTLYDMKGWNYQRDFCR